MDDFENVINGICEDLKSPKKTAKNNNLGQDQAQKTIKNEFPEKKKAENRGRKNRGLTNINQNSFNEFRKTLRNIENTNFSNEIIEKVNGEIIADDNIKDFTELYKITCDSVLNEFKENNIELVKKHPYTWYKPLLIELKKHVPPVTYKDIDKLNVVWDCLSNLLNSIGLYMTMETFFLFTKIYDYQLKNMEKVNPKYSDFRKKIITDRDSQLLNEIAMNPYNQTNKIFLAKTYGYIEKTEPKQIEVNHNIRNYDNISNYRIQDHN